MLHLRGLDVVFTMLLFVNFSQQLQVLKAAGKVSSVSSLGGEKVSLVNVRDVVQYMPQIRYMMSRLDGGAELSHAHSSKRQRVS